jgi:hypothetical protein
LASSEDNSRTSSDNEEDSQRQQSMQFKILDKLYTESKGYKYAFIPFATLKELEAANNAEKQELVRRSFESLRSAGLADSKAMGNANITSEGVKEYERAILSYPDSSTRFPLDAIAEAITEEKKNEIKTNQSQRRAFLSKAYELSKRSSSEDLNSLDIGKMLGYDQRTTERIHFYFQDEGVIKPIAIGGLFNITTKGMELAREQKEQSND